MTFSAEILAPGIIAALVGGYLLGSIPFGLVLTQLAGMGDIREIGSGNIGATNVLRTGNKPLAALTLVLDGGKGAIAVLLIMWLWPAPPLVTPLSGVPPLAPLVGGFAAVLGHNFPVWLKFKGGKGVATSLGTLLAVAWPVGLAAIATWILVAVVFRISSLSALAALGMAPLYAFYLIGPEVAVMALGLAILGFIRHHENIRRLLKGKEPKIGEKGKPD